MREMKIGYNTHDIDIVSHTLPLDKKNTLGTSYYCHKLFDGETNGYIVLMG